MSRIMRKKKKQNVQARQRLFHDKVSVILVTVVVVVLAVVLSFAQISLREKNQDYKAQEAELEKQLEQEAERSEEIDELEEYVGTDEYIEDVAKEKLGLVYPNEILFEAEP